MWIIYGVWKLSPVLPVLLRVCRSQELSPASDDRKRAGPRMETLAADGHPTRGSEDTGDGVIITLTCADQGSLDTTPSSQYCVPFILNNIIFIKSISISLYKTHYDRDQ